MRTDFRGPSPSSSLFLLPRFAESLTEAKVVSWLARVGESLKAGQPLVLVETDKTSIDVEVRTACIVQELLASEGAVVAVGEPLARLAPVDAAGVSPPPVRRSSAEKPVDLSRIHAHRSRWQARAPALESYLTLAVNEAFASAPRTAGPLEIGVFRASAPQGLTPLSLEPALPLLRVEALLRQATPRPGPLPRVVLTCGPVPAEGDSAQVLVRLCAETGRLTVTHQEGEAAPLAEAVARHLQGLPSAAPS